MKDKHTGNTENSSNKENLSTTKNIVYTFILEHISDMVVLFSGFLILYNILLAESKSVYYNLPYYFFIDINLVRAVRVLLICLFIILFIYENFADTIKQKCKKNKKSKKNKENKIKSSQVVKEPKVSDLFYCFLLILILLFAPLNFIFSLIFLALTSFYLINAVYKSKEKYGKKEKKKTVICFIFAFIMFCFFLFISYLIVKENLIMFFNKKYEVIQGSRDCFKSCQVVIAEHGDDKILVMMGKESVNPNNTKELYLTIYTQNGYRIIERNNDQIIKYNKYDEVIIKK